MIKAQNIIEDPPVELAYLLWQWLQELPFKPNARMYIMSRYYYDTDRMVISIYHGTPATLRPRNNHGIFNKYDNEPYWNYEILCEGAIAYLHSQNEYLKFDTHYTKYFTQLLETIKSDLEKRRHLSHLSE